MFFGNAQCNTFIGRCIGLLWMVLEFIFNIWKTKTVKNVTSIGILNKRYQRKMCLHACSSQCSRRSSCLFLAMLSSFFVLVPLVRLVAVHAGALVSSAIDPRARVDFSCSRSRSHFPTFPEFPFYRPNKYLHVFKTFLRKQTNSSTSPRCLKF